MDGRVLRACNALSVCVALVLSACDQAQTQTQTPIVFAPDSRPEEVVKPRPTATPPPREPNAGVTAATRRTDSPAYDRAEIRREKLHFAQAIAAQIDRNRPRYQVVSRATGVPWEVIGAIHNLEASLNFRSNLANGDPLTGRTTHVPRGRPLTGTPPFPWEVAAEDALAYDRLDRADWSGMRATLNNVERYNGLGYRRYNVPSPYLWSWTTEYVRGKFVADGVWSPTAISDQCGAVVALKLLRK